jgi:hypothetical protein
MASAAGPLSGSDATDNGTLPLSPPSGAAPLNPPMAPAPAPKNPSLWGSILEGALAGLSNASQVRGRGGFGAGMAAGSEGALKQRQIDIENQQRAQQLRFESARASSEMIDAMTRAHQEDRASRLTQAQIDQLNANTHAYLQDHNIVPNATISGSTPSEISTSASGGLSTIAQQTPDGTIPRLATFGSAVGVGANPDTHSVVAYHATQQPGADKRGVVDDYLMATRGLKSTDTEWGNGFGKVAPGANIPAEGLKTRDARSVGQDEQFVNAMQFRQVPAVPYKDNKVDTGAAASMQQTLQQQADNYAKLPNAKPDYAAFLQKKADTFEAVTKDVIAHRATLESQAISGTASAEASAAGLKTTSEQSAMEPFKQKERQFQAGLSISTELAKTANEKNRDYWADPQHGYVTAKQQFDTTNASIDAAKDGNGLLTSFVPTMEVLGMNVAAGVHRISPQESQAASLPGGYSERFNAWLDKASKGKLSPELVQEGHQLVGVLQTSAYNKVLAQSQMAAASGKIPFHQMPAMTPEGKITTLDRVIAPTGADVRVPGKGGKMFWGNSQTHAIIGPAE